MFKTIFGKQFAASFGTVLICLIVLGVGISGMVRNFFIEQKTAILKEQSHKISRLLISRYSEAFGKFIFDPFTKIRINDDFKSIQEYIEVSFFATDADFICFGATSDIYGAVEGKKISIPDSLISVLDGQTISYQGKIKDVFDSEVLTVANPVMKNGELKGAVFMATSMADLQENMKEFARILFICILIAAAVSFVIIYIISKTISKPIHQINEAAKEIASGDFEKRLVVKSRDEVGQLADSFNNMAHSLENQEKHRREFIANISHDLRSPLTSMRGFLKAIQDGTIPKDNHDHYIDIILDETERLSKLANDILDISKIQNMEIELNTSVFDLNELIRKTLIMFEPGITSKELEMSVTFAQERSNVIADLDKIQRVIYNLLDNAIKFTQHSGKISVETTINDDRVYVKIKDNGKGISPDEQKRVFERFYKADASRGEDKKGSGLGLSIVKEFIKAHGETITLTSEPGKGCEFMFGLALADD